MTEREFRVGRLLAVVGLTALLWLLPAELGAALFVIGFVVGMLLVVMGLAALFVWFVFPRRDPESANIVDVPDQGVKR